MGSFVRRMAENNPRIDLSRPIPIDRLASEFERTHAGGAGRAGGGDGTPRGAAAGHRSVAGLLWRRAFPSAAVRLGEGLPSAAGLPPAAMGGW